MEGYDADGTQPMEEGNESNAALLQLQDAFVSALTASGALGKIRAELRATALSLIRGDADLQRAAVGDAMRPTTLSPSSKLSLLLVYDFLQYHHLRQTAGVLEVEGSVHLFTGEQAALLGDLKDMPGKGPLLERLVQSYHPCHGTPQAGDARVGASASSADLAQPPAADCSPQLASTTDSAVAGMTVEDAVPDDTDVLHEYKAMEDSIPFSDIDGTIDAAEECDEVELV